MLKYINNSNTVAIVLHEIYGINEHISEVCRKLSFNGFDVLCPNLLEDNQSFDYNQEEIAYRNFYKHIGFNKSFNQVKALLEKCRIKYRYVCVIGYSVGATVAWLCSNVDNLCDAVVGFYGSRIRDYLEVIPNCPVLLFFPTEEKSFDVSCLTHALSGQVNVITKTLSGMHGFADSFSSRYVEESCCLANNMMFKFIKDKII